MEFIHKLFDSGKKQYIMGYNYVFVIVISGNFIFPLFVSLWLPKPHSQHRCKNDIFIDFIENLNSIVIEKGHTLSEIELSFDSAFCVQKVIQAVSDAELRLITKPNNNHKFEFEGEVLTPAELIEKVKNGHWKVLAPNQLYQRLIVNHHNYGEVVLIIRSKVLKNGKIIYDVLLCNTNFYSANRINKSYSKRWNIEMQFKYYKQYLNLGKTHRKLEAIQSSLYCVALVGLLVALYCRKLAKKISFKRAVKQPIPSPKDQRKFQLKESFYSD